MTTLSPEWFDMLDALVSAERRSQDKNRVVNDVMTWDDAKNLPSDAIRGLLDPLMQADQAIGSGLDYYLGPTGIPDKLRTITNTLAPDLYGVGYGLADLVDPRSSDYDRFSGSRDVAMSAALAPLGLLGLAPGGRAAKETVESGVNAVRSVAANPPARVAEFLADESGALPLPPLSNAQRTQIAGTFPTYKKAMGLLDTEIPEGRTLDFGAGLGMSRDLGFDTYEPFPRAGFDPTYRSAADIPDASYDRLTNLNVLNVVPREVRDQIVSDIGRVLKPGGVGVITTRGRDVMAAKGMAGPEPMSVITSADTYQKGFSQRELQEYLQSILGEAYGVSPVRLGPAGAMIRRNY